MSSSADAGYEWRFDGAARRVRQIALDLTDEALDGLHSIGTDRDKAVHDVRKKLKELRAVAELLRRRLPQRGRPDRDLFRDAGRRLAPTRDPKAAIEAFDHLRKHYEGVWTPRQFLKIRRLLVQRMPSAPDVRDIAAIFDALVAERRRIAGWPVDEMKQDELWDAVRRSYRRCRGAHSPEQLHDWRKRVKTHWHHVRLVCDTGLARLDDYAKALHKLTDILGDHHDLVILEQLEAFGAPAYVMQFRGFIAKRMRKLEEHADSLGRELFDARPQVWEEHARAAVLRHGPKQASRRLVGSGRLVRTAAR